MKPNKLSAKEKLTLVSVIADRAISLSSQHAGFNIGMKIDVMLSLEAWHEARPINLAGLAGANDRDLLHDVCGILSNISRKTGKPSGLFSPRYTAQGGAA